MPAPRPARVERWREYTFYFARCHNVPRKKSERRETWIKGRAGKEQVDDNPDIAARKKNIYIYPYFFCWNMLYTVNVRCFFTGAPFSLDDIYTNGVPRARGCLGHHQIEHVKEAAVDGPWKGVVKKVSILVYLRKKEALIRLQLHNLSDVPKYMLQQFPAYEFHMVIFVDTKQLHISDIRTSNCSFLHFPHTQ